MPNATTKSSRPRKHRKPTRRTAPPVPTTAPVAPPPKDQEFMAFCAQHRHESAQLYARSMEAMQVLSLRMLETFVAETKAQREEDARRRESLVAFIEKAATLVEFAIARSSTATQTANPAPPTVSSEDLLALATATYATAMKEVDPAADAETMRLRELDAWKNVVKALRTRLGA